METDLDAPRLLLVEDDRRLVALLQRLLEGEGYVVDVAPDGQAGLHRGLTRRYDAMVVDRGLPAVEGVDLVRRLRSRGVVAPVLVLTARGTTADRVEGLDAGAEDYLVKPFEVDELLARVRALLRRHTTDTQVVDLGGGRHLDVATQRVAVEGAEAVDLSRRETELLHLLATHPRQVFTRDDLARRLFPDADSPNAVDTYVYYLRRKLGRACVRTVRGLGYQWGGA